MEMVYLPSFDGKLFLSTLFILFILGIIQISYSIFGGTLIILLFVSILYFSNHQRRYLTANILFFLIGFSIYKFVSNYIGNYIYDKELIVLLNRISLLFVIICLSLTSLLFKKSFLFFKNKPEWGNQIYFPFIWKGFHSIKVSNFLIIAVLIDLAIFLPFIINQSSDNLKEIILFTVPFSIINGFLEEFIWRGLLLYRVRESTSDVYSLFITSVGFGLNHLSIGIPLLPSILFSIGGIFFAGVVLRSNSIYPSILWHTFINAGMVLSGFILK